MFCSVWNTHGFTAFKSGMPFETVKSRAWSWPMQCQGEALRLVLANVSRSASEPGTPGSGEPADSLGEARRLQAGGVVWIPDLAPPWGAGWPWPCCFTSPELQCPHPESETAKAHLGASDEGRLRVEAPHSVWWGGEEAASPLERPGQRGRGSPSLGPVLGSRNSCDAS